MISALLLSVSNAQAVNQWLPLNFGMVEVDWEAAQSPTVTISLSDVDGQKVFSYSFELDQLG